VTPVLAALFLALAGTPAPEEPRPRVVSLDYCADQYVLALAGREQILALSVQAGDAHSHLREQAQGLPRVRDAAEDVLAFEPDLIVRSYGGGARARAFYARLGLEVHEIGFAQDFDGVRESTRAAAEALGRPERGEALIARMEAALEAARRGPRLSALYLTASGATTGAGTMVHALLEGAGFDNAGAANGEAGWRTLPLERIALEAPDIIVTAFVGDGAAARDSWSPSDHPVFRARLSGAGIVRLDGAMTACAAWFMADAALEARAQANALTQEGAGE